MKIKSDKNLIATYMSLDSKKANEYLANLANQIKTEVQNSSDYDEVFEYLELLGEFVYKVPNETTQIVNHIVEQKSNSPAIHKSQFGEFEGKSHKDLILKCVELLGYIRYIAPDNVLKLIAQLSQSEDQNIKSKALEVVKKFAQYDFNILTKSKIGYGAQRKALDFILAWTPDERSQHIDFVEKALKELLSTSVEGTTSGLNDEAQYTITMHFGAVSPTDFLRKLRQEVIDLVYDLYSTTEDPKLKLKLVEILDETTRTPSNVAYGDDVAQMIVDDLKYLTGIYRKIVFPVLGKINDNLGIVATIEERLFWINKSEKRRIEESEKLRKEILDNSLYHLFRLFVGDPVTYKEQEGWDVAEKSRSDEIDQVLTSIEAIRLDDWFNKLNIISSQHVLVDEWKFNPLKGFLKKLAEARPQVADNLLSRSLEENTSLKHFAGSFLDGFRTGSHFREWDGFVSKIIGLKDIFLLTEIIFSLNLPADVDLKKLIRESDVDLLEKLAKQSDQFSFLSGVENRVLEYALFITLARNFKYAPARIEPLIVDEIKKYPQYLSMFFTEISMIIHRGWIEIENLQPETIDSLCKNLVELPDIDWHEQELLQKIGEKYGLRKILDVFLERIKKDEKQDKKLNRLEVLRYKVIPYHFNPDLIKFIVEDADYVNIAGEWVSKMTTDWSTYNWHISQLVQRIGKGFDEIIGSLIQNGDDNSLMKAARAMHSIEETNFDLCIEIVRKTGNKKIISQVDSNLYTTGVVSGEYGIAEAYESKAKVLEKYKVDESQRVRKFAERMISSFLKSAQRERQRADEEKQLRRIEFDK